MKIYPNPATNIINISTVLNVIDKLIINDLSGRIIVQVKGHNANNSININFLPRGLYILNIYTKDGSLQTAKFTKI